MRIHIVSEHSNLRHLYHILEANVNEFIILALENEYPERRKLWKALSLPLPGLLFRVYGRNERDKFNHVARDLAKALDRIPSENIESIIIYGDGIVGDAAKIVANKFKCIVSAS